MKDNDLPAPRPFKPEERAVDGLMLYNVRTTLWRKEDADLTANFDPYWLPAADVERGIESGRLKAGAFDNVKVMPPRAAWPEHWRFLQSEVAA